MSDVNETVGKRHRAWTLRGAALAAALAVTAPAWAQSAETLNAAEVAGMSAPPSYANAYPAEIDCNNPYYAQYCLAYANWLAAYGYGYYPYYYGYYGPAYPFDVAFGFGFFGGHRFVNFHRFAIAHGVGFRGGFHGGGFHGDGGFHGGGGGHR